MALLQNISLKNAQPFDRLGDTGEFWPSQLSWSLNRYVSFAGFSQYYGMPVGYGSPYGWILPPKAGGMAATNAIMGTGEISYANLAGLKRAVCSITNTSSVTGSIHGVGCLESTIDGIAIVDATIAALVKIYSDITGNATVEASLGAISSAVCNIIAGATVNADIKGGALISSDITGDALVEANISGIMYMVADMVASASVSADIRADAYLTANVSVGAPLDPLSPTALAMAVWNALANEYNDTGTMGQKLNSAAVGGVDYDSLAAAVLDAVLTGHDVSDSVAKTLKDIKKKSNMIPGLY
jgi:hypothetical protein